jgi:hypothetical protein
MEKTSVAASLCALSPNEWHLKSKTIAISIPWLVDLTLPFGLRWSLNNINFLHRSHLFARLASGDAPGCNYYLVDNIYPFWAIFVKTILILKRKKESQFTKTKKSIPKEHWKTINIVKKTLEEHSMSCKLDLPLFVVQLNIGRPSITLWHVVLFFTTCSLKMRGI